jgi:hypothetical protein
MKLEPLHFNEEEVISFLEYKLTHGEATTDEEILYEDYKFNNEEINLIELNKYTYISLVKEMKTEYEG